MWMNWNDVYYIEFHIFHYIEIIDYLNNPLWCQSAFCINERKESLWDGLHNWMLNFLSWSISLYVLLTISLLILHTVRRGVFFLFPTDPFFLSVIPRIFMPQSAKWNMIISLFPGVRAISDTLEHLVTSTFILLLPYYFINVWKRFI